MKIILVILFLFLGTFAVIAQDFPSPFQIIQDEEKFIFTDGSSYYLFKKDGSFKSEPLGISGREITGKWKLEDQLFVIQGKWGWINGGSRTDDYRKMTLYVGHPTSSEIAENLLLEDGKPKKIYKCYFEIEELQKIPKAKKKTEY